MLHSTDYLELFGIAVVSWLWLAMAAAASELRGTSDGERAFARGKLLAAEYWIFTETPRLAALVGLCRSGEDSYARLAKEEL